MFDHVRKSFSSVLDNPSSIVYLHKKISFYSEKSKTDEWKLTLKERKSSKKDERTAPVGLSTEQSQDEVKSHRG